MSPFKDNLFPIGNTFGGSLLDKSVVISIEAMKDSYRMQLVKDLPLQGMYCILHLRKRRYFYNAA